MRLSLIFSMLFAACTASATNVDSMLNAYVGMAKPYVILNVTASECITCRMAGANLLKYLRDSAVRQKVILLSDDKNMALYFRKNKDIYSGLKSIYNKELSDSLALGPSATVCLFDSAGDQKYLFVKVDDKVIRHVQNVLSGAKRSGVDFRRFTVKDSVFSIANRLSFSGNKALLFDPRFQIGFQFDLGKNNGIYLQPEYSDSTIEARFEAFDQRIKNLRPVKFAKADLRDLGVDLLTVEGLNYNANSLFCKTYAVSMNVSDNLADTNIVATPVTYIAVKKDNDSNLFDLDRNTSFLTVDGIYPGKDTLTVLAGNYQAYINALFLPYYDIRHSKSHIENGRVIMDPTAVSIVKFDNYTKGQNNYEVFKYRDTAKGPGKFFFRIDQNGEPVVFSETYHTITFLKTDNKLDYADLRSEAEGSVRRLWDVSFRHDTMWFAGVTTKDNYVKGYKVLNTPVVKLVKLNSELAYESMAIDKNNLLGVKKKEETEELVFDLYTLQ